MQRRAAAPAIGRDERIPLGKLGRTVDHWTQMRIHERRSGVRQHAVEHVDRGIAQEGSHASAFCEIGDEEGPAAGLVQLGGDWLEATAVSVALDHCGAFDRHRHPGELLPVGFDGGEIDGEHAAGGFPGRGSFSRGLECGVLQGHGCSYTGLAAAVQRMAQVPRHPLRPRSPEGLFRRPQQNRPMRFGSIRSRENVMSMTTPQHGGSAEPKLFIPALAPFYDRIRELSWPLIRLTAGGTLLVHGIVKLTGPGVAAFAAGGLARRGIEPALPLAYVIFTLETVGAVAIILGLFTRFFAAAIAIEFAVITFIAHWGNG